MFNALTCKKCQFECIFRYVSALHIQVKRGSGALAVRIKSRGLEKSPDIDSEVHNVKTNSCSRQTADKQ